MASAAASEAARIEQEIALLTASINRHKSASSASAASRNPGAQPRSNTYVNPNYKPPSRPATTYTRPAANITFTPQAPNRPVPDPSQMRDVVIGGVAFESSGRSLVRKDLPKPASKPAPPRTTDSNADFTRTKSGHLLPSGRTYKPTSRGRGRGRARGRGRGGPGNMTLNNSRRPYQSVLSLGSDHLRDLMHIYRAGRASKRKYLDKPCPRFTTTGACSRGLTCMYQHDASKIAICWSFLQGNCPNTAESCQLSHDPTPERTPLCVHFANNGRCNRNKCPYPHVRVGPRQGVCRDFAVLGYCEKGLDCDKQHVRECPDFAEKGACTNKGCKLPHVIRANRTRKPVAAISAQHDAVKEEGSSADTDTDTSLQHTSAENAQLGDEYISLTFNESESESSGEEEDEDEDEAEEGEEDEEEGDDPNELDVLQVQS